MFGERGRSLVYRTIHRTIDENLIKNKQVIPYQINNNLFRLQVGLCVVGAGRFNRKRNHALFIYSFYLIQFSFYNRTNTLWLQENLFEQITRAYCQCKYIRALAFHIYSLFFPLRSLFREAVCGRLRNNGAKRDLFSTQRWWNDEISRKVFLFFAHLSSLRKQKRIIKKNHFHAKTPSVVCSRGWQE